MEEVRKENAEYFELITNPTIPPHLLKDDFNEELLKIDISGSAEALIESSHRMAVDESVQLFKACGVQNQHHRIPTLLLEMEKRADTFLPVPIYNAAMEAFTMFSPAATSVGVKPDLDAVATIANRMQELNLQPNIETFEVLAKAAASAGDLDAAFDILNDVREHYMSPSTRVS